LAPPELELEPHPATATAPIAHAIAAPDPTFMFN
jgi:hypothetical protein